MRTVGVEIVGTIGGRPERRTAISGVSCDSRTVKAGELFFALPGARVDGHDFVAQVLEKGAAAAVISRDVNVPEDMKDRLVRVPDTLRALGASANAYRRSWDGPVIAVTGSNGKTTTREMTYHILSRFMPCKRSPRSFNTDIGVPLTLFQVDPGDRAVVVEMGANAPGEIAEVAAIAEPNIGIVTCIAESHLEGFGSLDGVARAKAELIYALPSTGTAILNADDPRYDILRSHAKCPVLGFGLGARADFRGAELTPRPNGHSFTIRGARVELNVPGRHNVHNALAALAVAEVFGLDLVRAASCLTDFRLPDMRFQMELIGGVHVIFDGYNANPGSMRAALDTFRETAPAGRRAAVLGDMLELGSESERLHRIVGEQAAVAGVDALWAVGTYAPVLVSAAKENGLRGTAVSAEKLEDVEQDVRQYLRPGDSLLVKGSRGMKLERLLDALRSGGGKQ